MIALELTFPTGRYRPLPQPEGLSPWPPSPWRLLSALAGSEAMGGEAGRAALEALSAAPPHYALPPRSARRTERGPGGARGDVVEVEVPAPVVVAWPDVELEPAARGALEAACRRLRLTGGRRSWVEVSVLDALPEGATLNASPSDGGDRELLAPRAPDDYAAFRDRLIGVMLQEREAAASRRALLEGRPANEAALSAEAAQAVAAEVPVDLVDALRAEGAEGVPHGAVRRSYQVEVERVEVRRRAAVPTGAPLPTVARMILAGGDPPGFAESVRVADRLHRKLVHLTDGHPVFTGRHPRSSDPLEGHRHAHIFCEANRRASDVVTHVTLYAPMGFDADVQALLASERWTRDYPIHGVRFILMGMGQPEDFAGAQVHAGQCPLLVRARTWTSLTPFVPTRVPKETRAGAPRLDANGLQKGSPEHDLRRLLRLAGLPEVEAVVPTSAARVGGRVLPWSHFTTHRGKHGKGKRGPQHGLGFEVRFVEEVEGPVAVGYGQHYGLGVFAPA